MAFDPDAYLAKKRAQAATAADTAAAGGGFDPDAYLAKKLGGQQDQAAVEEPAWWDVPGKLRKTAATTQEKIRTEADLTAQGKQPYAAGAGMSVLHLGSGVTRAIGDVISPLFMNPVSGAIFEGAAFAGASRRPTFEGEQPAVQLPTWEQQAISVTKEYLSEHPEVAGRIGSLIDVGSLVPVGKAGAVAKEAVGKVLAEGAAKAGAKKAVTAGAAQVPPEAAALANDVAARIRATHNAADNTVDIPGVGVKRLQDVTEEDLRTAVVASAPAGPSGPAMSAPADLAVQAAKKNLAPDAPRLRRDLAEQPYTREELKRVRREGSIEPVSYGEQALPAAAPVVDPGPGGFGRMIDDQAYFELSQPKAESTPAFDQLVNLAANPDRRINNALVVAGEKSLGEAFKDFDRVIAQKAMQKEKLLRNAQAAGVKIDLADIKQEWREQVATVARGALVKDEKGNWRVDHPDGGGHKINPENDQAIIDITEALDRAPDQADPKWADDVKRRIQAVARSTSYTQTGAVPSEAKRLSLMFSGKINERLKQALGDQYRNINADLHDYIGLEDLLGKVLGKQIIISESPREGGALVAQGVHKNIARVMKDGAQRVERADLIELFKAVERLSGGKHNPMQAASYAETAMILAGRKPMFQLADLPMLMSIHSPTGAAGVGMAMVGKAPGLVGRAASGGKNDAQFLIDYWRKAQAANGKRPPPPAPLGPLSGKPPEPPPAPVMNGPIGSAMGGGGGAAAAAPGPGGSPAGGSSPEWLQMLQEHKDAPAMSVPPAAKTNRQIAEDAIKLTTARQMVAGLPKKVQDQLMLQLQRPSMAISDWAKLVKVARDDALGPKPKAKAEDPFAGMGVMTKQQLKEREAVGLNLADEGAELPPEAVDPAFSIERGTITQKQLDDQDLIAEDDLQKAKVKAVDPRVLEARLQYKNRLAWRLGTGEIKPDKVPEEKLKDIRKWLHDYNLALENNPTAWYERYGQAGYPEVKSWSIGDFLHWINQGPTTKAQLDMVG